MMASARIPGALSPIDAIAAAPLQLFFGPTRLLFVASVWLLTQPLPAAAQQGWTDASRLSPFGVQALAAQVAVDPAGNATAVWGNSPCEVVAARAALPDGAWSPPSTLASCGWSPLIGGDAAGNLLAVWIRPENDRGVIEAVRYSSATAAWGPVTPLSNPTPDVASLNLAVSQGGHAIVAWERGEGSSSADSVAEAVLYDPVAGSWTMPAELSSPGQVASVRAAIDADGNAIAAWFSSNGPDAGTLEATRYSASSRSWGDTVVMTTGGADGLVMAMDRRGNAMLAWKDDSVIRTTRFAVATGSWSDRWQVSGREPGSVTTPDLAFDADGDLVVVWAVNESAPAVNRAAIQAAHYLASTNAWSAPVNVSVHVFSSAPGRSTGLGPPQIEIDRAGHAFVLSEQVSSLGTVVTTSVLVSRYTVGGDILSPRVSLASEAGQTSGARLAFDTAGNAVVIWRWSPPFTFPAFEVQSRRWLQTPAAPEVASIRPGTGTVMLLFSAPATTEPGAEPTTYEYSLDAGATWTPRSPASTVSPLRVGGLVDGEAYRIRLRARNTAGAGAMSAEVVATPATGPDPPTALTVLAKAGQTVTVGWTPPDHGLLPTGYVLDGGLQPAEVVASLPTGGTGPTFTFVAPTGAYYIHVHAVADTAWSEPSNEIRLFVNVPAPPSAPANLLGLVNESGLALSWTNTFAGGTPTSLWLNVTGAMTATLPLPVGDRFTYAGVPPGTYTLSLSAANPSGVSAPSNPVTLTFPAACTGVPEPPTHLRTWKAGSTIFLTWSPPASGTAVTGYTVLVRGGYVGSFPTTGRTLSGVAAPGSYELSVAATNPCGRGGATPAQLVVIP